MSVFVVDDDPFFLKLMQRQLEVLGETAVTCFEHAGEALAALSAAPAAQRLVLCDLQMPGMDGVELVRNLGAMGYAGDLILVSGEDERILNTAALLARAHRLNLLGAVRKPVPPEQLKTLLETHHAGRAARAAPPRRRRYEAAELAEAIARDELICHYQPKVRLADAVVEGVECLVRWNHPRDGIVPPDDFIPLAEEHGLIGPLTMAVLRHGIRQAREWNAFGLALHLSVNVSMDNLVNPGFTEDVIRELDAAGLGPEQLVLEVTESRLMNDPLSALDILVRLRLKRVGLSVDDFGTGHSTFSKLRDLPFTELKIDRGFVRGAAQDPTRRAIFEASLTLARQLGLKVVAEGAETLEDWRFLRASGCDVVQGWFVARAMPGAALPGWLAEWERGRPALLAEDPA